MATKTDEQKKKEAAARMRRAREAKKQARETAAAAAPAAAGDEVKNGPETPSGAENATSVTADSPEAGQRVYTEEEVRKLLEEAEKKRAAETAQIVVKMSTPESERVAFLWQAPVADYNVLEIGENGRFGRVTGKTDTFWVPKSELSGVLTEAMRNYIRRRWLIVLSGVSDEEREILGCAYKDGELLSREAFRTMLDMGDELVRIFPGLCRPHKEMVAQRYYEAYLAQDPRVTRDRVLALNELSKKDYADAPQGDPNRAGLFARMIREMNRQDETA